MSDFRRRTVVANIPYDAEIEYLGSDSSAYIDTGILPNNITEWECEFSYSKYTTSGYIVSSYEAETQNGVRIQLTTTNDNTMYVNCGLRWDSLLSVPTIVKNELIKLKCVRVGNQITTYKNDILISTQTLSDGTQCSKSIVLLNRGKIGDSQYIYRDIGAKIKSFKAYEGNNIVIDYKAVRKNGIGYMYDKVSHQLFGNSGTGNFILGPDL